MKLIEETIKMNIKEDPWMKICDDIGISSDMNWFVSKTISREVIMKYGRPEKLIPIYNREQLLRHPFLYINKLTPIRVGKGEAILTKAPIIQSIPRSSQSNNVSITLPKKKEHELKKFSKLTSNTEAKLLSIAYNYGVFNRVFNDCNCWTYNLGLFGKLNLPRGYIGLIDFEGNKQFYQLEVNNVQFELDFSLEDEANIFVIEAKAGETQTFSILQLYYPYIYLEKYASESGKMVRPILIDMRYSSNGKIDYKILEFGFNKSNVLNSIYLKGVTNISLIFSSQYYFD